MKKVAIFDFDGTLIKGDSLLPFLSFVAGNVAVFSAIVEGVVCYIRKRAEKKPVESRRTFIKRFLLRRILKGKKKDDLRAAVLETLSWMKTNEAITAKLREHREKGDVVVIASGSLDLYLSELLQDIPHDALICTEVGVENGVVTGEMIKGNCVRKGKAARVKEWLDKNGPFEDSFGYGNAPHDLPMLELVKHKMVV